MSYEVVQADVLEWAAGYEGEKFHALLTDSPYSLHFMGKSWDKDIAFQSETWEALTEHLHPGAFGMSFASARGWHRLAVAIEDAGLIIHPSIFMLGWIQSQGFPKASRVKVNGKEPKEWSGHRYGLQAMKPSLEPIIVFQKPYAGKPVESIVSTGAGALWIDGARVATGGQDDPNYRQATGNNGGADSMFGVGNLKRPATLTQGRWPPNVVLQHVAPDADGNGGCVRVGTRRVKPGNGSGVCSGKTSGEKSMFGAKSYPVTYTDPDGLETVDEWQCVPDCPARMLGEQSGERRGFASQTPHDSGELSMFGIGNNHGRGFDDTGTAARFFPQFSWQHEVAERSFDYAQDRLAGVTPFYYCAKSARRERDAGLEGFEYQQGFDKNTSSTIRRSDPDTGMVREFKYTPSQRRNNHPCCKPIALALWLARLLAPPPEYAPRRLLVPFSGSGSEICSAILSGCWEDVTGVELEPDYVSIAHARVSWWQKAMELTKSSDPKDILRLMKRIETKQGEVHDHQLELFEQHHLP
jgi:hypothetical protein